MSVPLLSNTPIVCPFNAAPAVIAPIAVDITPNLSIIAEIVSRNAAPVSAAPFKNSLSAITDAKCS